MRRIRFESAFPGPTAVLLEGAELRGRLEQPAAGIWRLLVERRETREKQPLAASSPAGPHRPLPIEAGEKQGGFLVTGEGAPLFAEAAPLSLRWRDVLFEPGLDHGRLTLRWSEDRPRRYAGLGERAARLPLPRRHYQNWTTDAGNYAPGDDPLYQAHPFLFALEQDGSAWGLLLDESWRTDFRLARPGARSKARTAGPTLDAYLIEGPTPEDLLARLSQLCGRAPMPPRWALGYHQCRWGYRDEAEVRRLAGAFREHELPIDALWLDIDYMDRYRVFTFDPDRFPDPRGLCTSLERQGIRTVVIVDPGVSATDQDLTWQQGRERDYFVRDEKGPYIGACWPERCAWPDFSRDEVRRWWGDRHRFYLEAGVAGIWNDMNEPANLVGGEVGTLPMTAHHGERSHAELHNLYGLDMSRATREGLARLDPERRPFVLTRSGFTGIQRHAWVWTGDNHSSFGHMALSIPMLLHLGLSGVPFCGADIGGFSGDCSGELLARWSWLGALYPLMRNHAAWDTARQEPWVHGEPTLSAVREALRFRYRILPYLYTLAKEATETGLPILRPLFFVDPTDPEAARDDQLMVGSALLAAPALERGCRSRSVYLPAGRWQDFWTGAWHKGPAVLEVAAPLDRIPLFQRAGTAVPLSKTPAPSEEARWPELCWRVAPGPEIAGSLYEDRGDGPTDGETSELTGTGTSEGGELKLHFRDQNAAGRTSATAEILEGQSAAPRLIKL